jgi:hypothetical protein
MVSTRSERTLDMHSECTVHHVTYVSIVHMLSFSGTKTN